MTSTRIPIIVYHGFVNYDNIRENKISVDTSMSLFEQWMKYLNDEWFNVLLIGELLYDNNNNSLYTSRILDMRMNYSVNQITNVKISP